MIPKYAFRVEVTRILGVRSNDDKPKIWIESHNFISLPAATDFADQRRGKPSTRNVKILAVLDDR